jgi:hypothetical protein
MGQQESPGRDRAYWLLHSAGQNGLTADEADALVADGSGVSKINCIAPWFTRFVQLGIAVNVGRRATRNGSQARVRALGPGAEAIYAAAYGRPPMGGAE